MPLTFEELEALHPVMTVDDFMGKEHFRVYGDKVGMTHRLSGLLFKTLVYPDGFKHAYRHRNVVDHTQQEGVIIHKRWNVGFDYFTASVGSYERTKKVVNQLVIATSSVILISENPSWIESRYDVGPDNLDALNALAHYLKTRTTQLV